jgi:superfamily II DNA helicase RecQ
MIVVDEAHTCTISGYGRQLRYQMLKSLSNDPDRHLLLLTATPHPGKDEAFYNLLSLLRPDFARLPSLQGEEKRKLREDLGAYLVQRQRQDIKQWNEPGNFPVRMVKEITYKLENEWGEFFEDLRDYCYNLAQRVENERGEQRSAMIWYATLAMLRCASSSPEAAHKALTNRLTGIEDPDVLMDERLGDGEELASSDEEPCANIEESETLKKLIAKADALRGSKKDPKLAALLSHITSLISERPAPFRPVIFCRYIATANYVKEHLQEQFTDRFPGAVIDVVTGLLSPEEREQKVEELLEAKLPILVATDCLSEGINLQHGFNAVVHYDLAWNPTRHEQREGRVDRFGQESPEVRCTMIYGQNNPVDGFILNVILKKAQQIKTDLGFQVHLPEDNARIQQALVKAALMKPSRKNQSEFDFGDDDDSLAAIESEWRDAQEKAPANRTIFAQRRLRPQDVIPELKKQEALTGSGDQDVIPELKKQEALTGSGDDVRLFLETALRYLGSPLQQEKEDVWKYDPSQLDPSLRERLAEENSGKPRLLGFKPEQGAIFIHRSHPIVSIIASYILENALEKNRNGISPNSEAAAARCAVFETGSVNKVTTLYILRVRHELDYIMSAKGKHDNQTKKLLAEESLVLGRTGRDSAELLKDEAVSPLMNAFPTGNISPAVMIRELKTAIAWFVEHRDLFDEAAHKRADVLLADHRTVRDASDARGQYNVKACLPADLIGVFVLLPKDI